MNIENIESQLLIHLEQLDAFLNEKELHWKEVRGALNMVKNKQREHYTKLKRKLFMDYRMIGDHQIDDPNLNMHMEEAWKIAETLEIKKI